MQVGGLAFPVTLLMACGDGVAAPAAATASQLCRDRGRRNTTQLRLPEQDMQRVSDSVAARPDRFPFAARPAGRGGRGCSPGAGWRQTCLTEVAAGSAVTSVKSSHLPLSAATTRSRQRRSGVATMAEQRGRRCSRALRGRSGGRDVRVRRGKQAFIRRRLISRHVRPLTTGPGRAKDARPQLPQWLPCVAEGSHGATGPHAIRRRPILRTAGCIPDGCDWCECN
jgi:hypothetical protein